MRMPASEGPIEEPLPEAAVDQRATALPLTNTGAVTMGRGILLWMLGVPIPIILLLAMCSHN
jgi:hypothetical protein